MEEKKFHIRGHVYVEQDQSKDEHEEHQPSTSPTEAVAEKERAENEMVKVRSRLEAKWQATMCHEFQIADRYSHVAVLIVRWADELDDLNCRGEVEELHNLFQDDFKFKSSILKLDVSKRPQIQLNHAISSLVIENEGPSRSNLLIVYYSGHGVGVAGENILNIKGQRKANSCSTSNTSVHDARANWNEAERDLTGAEADVLEVLDCCNAANIISKGGDNDLHCHEILTASGRSELASKPGPESFTRHFIDALKEQLQRNNRQPFTIPELNEVIMRRRQRFSSQAMTRHGHRTGRHIALAPLDPLASTAAGFQTSAVVRSSPETASLDLRVTLKSDVMLSDTDVESLAREISQAAKRADAAGNMGILSIDWTHYKPSVYAVLLRIWRNSVRKTAFAHKWRESSKRTREKKRKAEEPLEEAPEQKRLAAAAAAAAAATAEHHSDNPLTPTSAISGDVASPAS